MTGMKWMGTILLAAVLAASVAPAVRAECGLNEEALKGALGHEATKAIEEKYHEDRSWYPSRFKILSVTPTQRNQAYDVVMEIPSCTIRDIRVHGVDHDDIVTLRVGLVYGIRVLKIEQKY
jgi:hypothetical protein